MKNKKKFYEDQYRKGETKGPWWYQKLSPYVKTREDVALGIISNFKGKKRSYIDLGCGEGDLVNRLESQFKNLIGTDIAKNRLSIANSKYKSAKVNFEFVDLDTKLPYKTNSIDVVSCLGVIEYTFDPYFVMKEIRRILKPGGILILEVPNLGYLPERIKLFFGFLPSWPDAPGWQGGRLHNFTHRSMYKLGSDTNFKTISLTGSGFLQYIRSKYSSLLCGDCIATYKK
jgi:ubiquinone/menaquinone biosynthesis C-methylase UbiE